MSLQKPSTIDGFCIGSVIGVVLGAGQAQLPFGAPVARSNAFNATGAVPLS